MPFPRVPLSADLACSISEAINFLFAFPAVYTIDTFGRRNLLLFTFPNMAWSLRELAKASSCSCPLGIGELFWFKSVTDRSSHPSRGRSLLPDGRGQRGALASDYLLRLRFRKQRTNRSDRQTLAEAPLTWPRPNHHSSALPPCSRSYITFRPHSTRLAKVLCRSLSVALTEDLGSLLRTESE